MIILESSSICQTDSGQELKTQHQHLIQIQETKWLSRSFKHSWDIWSFLNDCEWQSEQVFGLFKVFDNFEWLLRTLDDFKNWWILKDFELWHTFNDYK